MSGHWRLCVAAFLLFAGLSNSPAFSNPLTDLLNPAPKEAAAPAAAPASAPAPAKEQCLPQPGRSAAPGQHWVYHLDGHRKCWFLADEATVAAKRQVQHHAARQPVIASGENEAALRQKRVADARAQLVNAAPADAIQPTPPAPEAVDPPSAPANVATVLVPAAPLVAEPAVDQPKLDQPKPDQPAPDHAARRPVDVETLLAAAPPVGDMAASAMPPAASVAPSISDADANGWELMAKRAGLALIALGLVFVIASLLASRFRDPGVAPIRRA